MSEMIERVARKLFDEWHAHAVAMAPTEYPDATWEDDADQPLFRFLARAAIEAMREPTSAMCVIGHDVAETVMRKRTATDFVSVTWAAMIDDILNDA